MTGSSSSLVELIECHLFWNLCKWSCLARGLDDWLNVPPLLLGRKENNSETNDERRKWVADMRKTKDTNRSAIFLKKNYKNKKLENNF